MHATSISELKTNPASVITQSLEYPVAVESRNKVQAYLIGKNLYEKMIALLEDKADRAVIADTDYSKGKDFENVAKELGI